MSEENGPMQVDVGLIRQLAELLDDTHLTEIEVEDGDRRIRVARKAASATPAYSAPAPAPPPPLPVAAPGPAPTPAPAADSGSPVKSPMVGTVYLAAEPGARPFVSVGDSVNEGQTVVIIEAMKVMNPIPAPRAGTVTRVCIENGQPVEFDQTLIIIE